MKARPSTPPALGSVRADELLPLRVFCQRLGIHKAAWAALAKRGFPTITAGKQKLVDGSAALGWFRSLADMQQQADGSGGATFSDLPF